MTSDNGQVVAGPGTRHRSGLLALAGFCLAAAIALTLSGYALWISHQQEQARRFVMSSQNILDALSDVGTTLSDIDARIRGYIIAGDEIFLAEQGHLYERANEATRRLRTAMADFPDQQARLDKLEADIQKRLEGARALVEVRRARGFSVARDVMINDIPLRIAAQVRPTLKDIELRQNELLDTRERQLAESISRFRVSVGGLMAILIVMLAFLYVLIGRRQTAEVQLLQHEERFRLMAENIVEYAIILLDAEGRVTTWNPGAERIKGYRAGEITGQHFSRFYPAEDAADGKPQLLLERAQAGGRATDEGWRIRKDGTRFWAYVVITALRDPVGNLHGYAKLTRDLTDRKRMDAEKLELNAALEKRVEQRTAELALANQQLERGEARLRGILDSAMDAIITVDDSQAVVMFNKAAEVVFQCPQNQAVGAPLAQFLPARFRDLHSAHLERFGQGSVVSRRMASQRIVTGLRRNGEEFPIDASISYVDDNGRKLYTVILRDVTERVQAETELRKSKDDLRELAAQASAAREQEKSRVARELHDETAQDLSALKMDMNWISEHLSSQDTELIERLRTAQAMLDSIVKAVRRIAADLRPLMLDDLGLVPAAEWLTHNFSQRNSIECRLDVAPPDLELHEPHATAVFRILQESLTNVGKHAQATVVEVTITRTRDEIMVKVKDDGRGFSTIEPRKTDSFGLAGLRERAYLLGGTIIIDSAPGHGTMVTATLPLAGLEQHP